ncbi:hypothetical protein A8F94_19120 [Bacillus sp. FJAT-27225]|uniref:hypothetical protein n=1 Tax=Bacillus sp. FJAT-27225 TaxID=1743144 RepID=UPI00080C22EE|nr:hypothetical protein [Bacillus sp. FJAT-27225]OCA83221.1 hypothetical protein A8F94_19120 [Bacillus sp. FJAT-27225]
MRMAKVGLLFDQREAEKKWADGENVFEVYLFEVFDHLRIPYEKIGNEAPFHSYDLIIEVFCRDQGVITEKLLSYLQSGGTLISYGGLNGLKESLGLTAGGTMDKGYARLSDLLSGELPPLRFLHAQTWENTAGVSSMASKGTLSSTKDAPEQSTLSAFQRIEYGAGKIERWSISVPGTIAGIQQGTGPVEKDGVPAPDGTANLDENLLKADDGFELDWVMDRSITETGMPYFDLPYADLWKKAIVEHILACAAEKGLTLPFVDFWPDGIEHIAMISHDSDLNVDESALTTLEVLKSEGVNSTWCMIAPGYSPAIYEKIKSDGHEIALHYNALEQEDGIWSEDEFISQLEWLKQTTGTNDIVSNKNHYTIFKGWGELFSWCEKHGIQADQTRGPSKKGNIGFLFGTCHPYFPVAWADEKNRFYDVVEIGFLTQDLNHHTLADSSVIQPFLDGVKNVNGVAHFLFHQYHIYNQPPVREALIELMKTAKNQGFSFWTSAEINKWERERRKVSIRGISGEIEFDGQPEQDGLVLLIPIEAEKGTNQLQGDTETVTRFGFRCRKVKPVSYVL